MHLLKTPIRHHSHTNRQKCVPLDGMKVIVGGSFIMDTLRTIPALKETDVFILITMTMTKRSMRR